MLYVGTATFKGGDLHLPDDGFGDGRCDPPSTVRQAGRKAVEPFHLCFKSPTTYVNCQNPDNDPAMALRGRGARARDRLQDQPSVVGQVTIHTDHPFWDSVLHDSPAHFDQFAARVAGMGRRRRERDVPTVTLEMTEGVNYRAYTDALGNQLPWRYCIAPPTDVHSSSSGRWCSTRRTSPGAGSERTAAACATTTTSRPTTRARRGT